MRKNKINYLLFTLIACLVTVFSFAQPSFESWEAESRTNKRLLPRYGLLKKTAAELKADSVYISDIMAMPQFKSRREASIHLIGLGFQYLYRPDYKTAMYRFNQAYLLDSTNTDIYWGYGVIYSNMGRFDLAREQFEMGLSIDSNNFHILTDMGTYFMQQYFMALQMPVNDHIKDPQKEAENFMDSAMHYLNRSYGLDKKYIHTVYKLSICHWAVANCTAAWKYYDEAVALGGQPVTEEYTRDLMEKCKR
jgi:Tfp pilus assembly protein PilF